MAYNLSPQQALAPLLIEDLHGHEFSSRIIPGVGQRGQYDLLIGQARRLGRLFIQACGGHRQLTHFHNGGPLGA